MRTAITIAKPHGAEQWELLHGPQIVDLTTGKPVAGTPIHEQAAFIRELRQSPVHNVFEAVQFRADFEEAVTLRFKKPTTEASQRGKRK